MVCCGHLVQPYCNICDKATLVKPFKEVYSKVGVTFCCFQFQNYLTNNDPSFLQKTRLFVLVIYFNPIAARLR
jgi:hypothetical protein